MPDLVGAIVGGLSVIALVLLYWYSDQLSDGNVGADDE